MDKYAKAAIAEALQRGALDVTELRKFIALGDDEISLIEADSDAPPAVL